MLCTAFTSCTKDLYDPDRPEKDAQELYRQNFLKYVNNTIADNQDWGFGATVKAATRADDAPTVKKGDGYSTEFTNTFFDTVMEYFPEGAVCKSTDWYNYEFLQNGEYFNVRLIYSHTRANDEVGFYYYDPATGTCQNHVKVPLYTDIQNDEGNLNEFVQFNRYTTGGQWFPYRTYRGYEIWTMDNPAKRIQTRTYTIYMDKTYRFGFYVTNKDTGKTYYSNQYLNADNKAYSGAAVGDKAVGNIPDSYVFGLTDNDTPDCNFLFAIAKKGEDGKYPLLVKPQKWYRIIAEDLNVHDMDSDGDKSDTDFDFNDIVLDAILTTNGAKCKLQAAGATLKIRINGIDSLEVHKMFGVDQDVMVNTKASSKGLKGKELPPVEFEIKGSFASIKDIKLEVYRQDHWMELKALEGDVASKICVGTDFVWPDERVSLKAKYPGFLEYVNYNNNPEWWK